MTQPSLNSKFQGIRDYFSRHHLPLLTIIITLIAIVVSIWLTVYYRRPNLSYETTGLLSLINQENIQNMDGNWELSYSGKLVNHPFLIIYTVKNSGARAIKKEDFGDETINITMPKGSEILNVSGFLTPANDEFVNSEKSIRVDINNTTDKSTVQIQPLLLNSEESLTLKVICDIDDPYQEVIDNSIYPPTVRIANLKKIEQDFSTTRASTKLSVKLSIPLLLILLISLYVGTDAFFKKKIKSLVIYIAVSVLALLELFWLFSS